MLLVLPTVLLAVGILLVEMVVSSTKMTSLLCFEIFNVISGATFLMKKMSVAAVSNSHNYDFPIILPSFSPESPAMSALATFLSLLGKFSCFCSSAKAVDSLLSFFPAVVSRSRYRWSTSGHVTLPQFNQCSAVRYTLRSTACLASSRSGQCSWPCGMAKV